MGFLLSSRTPLKKGADCLNLRRSHPKDVTDFFMPGRYTGIVTGTRR